MDYLKRIRNICVDAVLNPSNSEFELLKNSGKFPNKSPVQVLLTMETTQIGKDIIFQANKFSPNKKWRKFQKRCKYNTSENILYESVFDKISLLQVPSCRDLWEIYKLRIEIGDFESLKLIPGMHKNPLNKHDVFTQIKSLFGLEPSLTIELLEMFETTFPLDISDLPILEDLYAMAIDNQSILDILTRLIEPFYKEQEEAQIQYISEIHTKNNPNHDQLELLYLVLNESDGIPSKDEINYIISSFTMPFTIYEQTRYDECVYLANNKGYKNIVSILKDIK